MNISILQHVPFEGPGSISQWISKNSFTENRIHLYKKDPLPLIKNTDFLIIMGGPMNILKEIEFVVIQSL